METKHKAMIDSIELRIGNLAYPMDRSGEVPTAIEIPFKIMEITQIDVRGHIASQPLHQVVKYDEFSIRDIIPIPLTEEWLLKAGAKRFGKDFTLHRIIIHSRKRGFVINKSVPIMEYLHQLQNFIFANRGKELEFKL